MSYPQTYPQEHVDRATHRPQYLTDSRDGLLYLKDNLSENKRKIKINKKQIKIKTTKTIKSAILVSIIILTITSIEQAKAVSQTDLLKLYAHSRIINYQQTQCFITLIERESHWNVAAKNGSHYGLGQMNNAKYKTLDGFTQVDWSIRYITKRYKSMCNAWRFFKAKGYH